MKMQKKKTLKTFSTTFDKMTSNEAFTENLGQELDIILALIIFAPCPVACTINILWS
jgi:hypothetical protein